jgi:hypothetical protein
MIPIAVVEICGQEGIERRGEREARIRSSFDSHIDMVSLYRASFAVLDAEIDPSSGCSSSTESNGVEYRPFRIRSKWSARNARNSSNRSSTILDSYNSSRTRYVLVLYPDQGATLRRGEQRLTESSLPRGFTCRSRPETIRQKLST